jgi:hypothetical protein
MQTTTMEFTFVSYWLQAISGLLFFLAGLSLFLGIALSWMQVAHAHRWAVWLGLQTLAMFAFAVWTTSRVAWSLIVIGGLCGFFVAFAIWLLHRLERNRQPKPLA